MAAKFTDDKGRVWTVKLTLDGLSRLETAHGIDVFEAVRKPGGVHDLMFSRIDRVRLALFCCVQNDAHAQGVTWPEFVKAVDSAEAYRSGVEALAQAVTEFFPEAKPEAEEDRQPRPSGGRMFTALRRWLAWLLPARTRCGSCSCGPKH